MAAQLDHIDKLRAGGRVPKTTALFLEEDGKEAAEVNNHCPPQWPEENQVFSALEFQRFSSPQAPRETIFSSRSTVPLGKKKMSKDYVQRSQMSWTVLYQVK